MHTTMQRLWRRVVASLLGLTALLVLAGDGSAYMNDPVLIGLDAEFGHPTSTSAQAIQQGIEIAIEEINQAGGVLNGRQLALVTRDNRSVTAIGVDNLRELATLKDMTAVFGGKFSPVYIECLPLAHHLGILLLDPWGSADPITDHGYRPSFTFRLSLKDAWAGPAFVRFAQTQYDATRLGLLLPNTAWGRSNQAAIAQAARDTGAKLVGERWYNWGDASLATQYRELHMAGAQAIILVANEAEGALLVREVAALPAEERLPLISHWGITGGNFARLAGDALRQVEFSVIQTYSFIGQQTPAARRVLTALRKKYGIEAAGTVQSPVGVAHAYDLTHLLARAINRAGSTNPHRIRAAMEQLEAYDGLIQRYGKPFTASRHDALSAKNVFFARYTPDGQLIPVAPKNRRAVRPAPAGAS